MIRPDETFLLTLKAVGFDPKSTGNILYYQSIVELDYNNTTFDHASIIILVNC